MHGIRYLRAPTGRPALLHRVSRALSHSKRSMRKLRNSAILPSLLANPSAEGVTDPTLIPSYSEAATLAATTNSTIKEKLRKTTPPSLERPLSMRSEISRIELILRETQLYLTMHLSQEWYYIPPESDSIQLCFIAPLLPYSGKFQGDSHKIGL